MKASSYDTFIRHLDDENKEATVTHIRKLLSSGEVTLEELYLDFITPALNEFTCTHADEDICIWKEHRRTSIIRTILEMSYLDVLEQKASNQPNHPTVIVVCPEEEYHEIGAIIATQFFTLNGYDAAYIGANTPKDQILKAVATFKPDVLALSVTNYYNLITTKKTIQALRKAYPGLTIAIGGSAFHGAETRRQIDHDVYIDDLRSVNELMGGNTL